MRKLSYNVALIIRIVTVYVWYVFQDWRSLQVPDEFNQQTFHYDGHS